jgi:mannan endo-1,4-beta-mannosidase
MHENNGTFFWRGGRSGQYGTAMLFREIYNRMTYVHKLNNLVWVWNQNGPAPGGEFYGFYPGPQYADIVSYDNYSTLDDRYYQEILTIANGKPLGFGEVGSPPPPEVLASQPKMAFYMTWGGMAGTAGGWTWRTWWHRVSHPRRRQHGCAPADHPTASTSAATRCRSSSV